ncbi:Gfo/Idh/MocA family oxidoreductase [Candidatus Poribacteria bacterium]|nr:Gfo/Idh/MocA family oxidoreductase [Candidatus Poribacteria bacterium]MYA56585.1 Gfo/Idh/MocA family oxidoreductase [Candidatus Poribacteria bacterium]
MRKAKIASVGCGWVAKRWHLPTIAELTKRGDLDYVAVCDIDEDTARAAGEEYGLPYYTDVEQMLEKHSNIDVVDISTGDYEHHTIAKIAAEHKMHPIVEKPMAPTLTCCDVIIDSCEKNGVHFEVAENYFRMPGDRIIIKLIQEGVLGDIARVHFIEPFGRRPFEQGAGKPRGIESPISTFTSHSGVCIDMGVHRMSQLRCYAQSEPKKITGITKQFAPSSNNNVYEDWGHAVIEFESGAVGVYETSRVGEETIKYRQIMGTKGVITDTDFWTADFPLRVMENGEMKDIPIETERHHVDGVDVLSRIVVHTDPQIVYENPFRTYAIDDWNVGTAEEIMTIARAALTGEPPEYGVGGRKDVEMCIALYESSRTGMMPIDIPITETTGYEQMVHDEFRQKFGHAIDA